MNTHDSHTFSLNYEPSQSHSSNSDTHPPNAVEPDFLHNTTGSNPPDARPSTGEFTPVHSRRPESPFSSVSSEGRRSEQAGPPNHLQDARSGEDRGEVQTLFSGRSISTLVSDSEGIDQDVSRTSVESRRPWTPFFLQRATILGFITAYVSLLVALIVLAILDDRNQGLATVDSNLRYVWTYGPTAGTAFLQYANFSFI